MSSDEQQQEQQQQQETPFHRALRLNKLWAQRTIEVDPNLLPTLKAGQSPAILWIGCSDSRVPETTILGLKPGDVFVHRNIANILVPTDLASLSVIEYAVVYLKVRHIILCGHTSCGGVNGALGNKKLGLVDTWLMPLRQLRKRYWKELQACGDQGQRAEMLAKWNVKAGVEVLRQNPNVVEAMRERGLKVHGLIYDVGGGEIEVVDDGEGEEAEEERDARVGAFDVSKND